MQADKHPVLFFTTVSISVLLALWLLILPLPQTMQYFRPEWSCLLVVYWILVNPNHLGLGFAFLLGLLQDVFEQTIWGANALGLVVVAYVCVTSYRRVQRYSVWQQSLWILVLVGLYQVSANAIMRLGGTEVYLQNQVPSILVSGMCWPPFLFVARWLKKRLALI